MPVIKSACHQHICYREFLVCPIMQMCNKTNKLLDLTAGWKALFLGDFFNVLFLPLIATWCRLIQLCYVECHRTGLAGGTCQHYSETAAEF